MMLDAAERVVTRLGEWTLSKAVPDAPIEHGDLRGSARLDVHRDGNSVEAILSFNEVYAARQHEELTWKHPRGGKAKYLEDNVNQAVPLYEGMLAAELKATLQ